MKRIFEKHLSYKLLYVIYYFYQKKKKMREKIIEYVLSISFFYILFEFVSVSWTKIRYFNSQGIPFNKNFIKVNSVKALLGLFPSM